MNTFSTPLAAFTKEHRAAVIAVNSYQEHKIGGFEHTVVEFLCVLDNGDVVLEDADEVQFITGHSNGADPRFYLVPAVSR